MSEKSLTNLALGLTLAILVSAALVPWWLRWPGLLVVACFWVPRAAHALNRRRPAFNVVRARKESHALGLPFIESDGTLSYAPVPDKPERLVPVSELQWVQHEGRISAVHPEDVHRTMHERRMQAQFGTPVVTFPPTATQAVRDAFLLRAGPRFTEPHEREPVKIRRVSDHYWAIGGATLPYDWTPDDWRWAASLSKADFNGVDPIRLPSARRRVRGYQMIRPSDLTRKQLAALHGLFRGLIKNNRSLYGVDVRRQLDTLADRGIIARTAGSYMIPYGSDGEAIVMATRDFSISTNL